jgi:hypothetical protein
MLILCVFVLFASATVVLERMRSVLAKKSLDGQVDIDVSGSGWGK